MKDKHNQSFKKDKTDIIRSKRYITYICPATIRVPGCKGTRKCGKIEKRLGDHLARKHHIARGSRQMKILMEKAEPLRIKRNNFMEDPNPIIIIDSSEEEKQIKKETDSEDSSGSGIIKQEEDLSDNEGRDKLGCTFSSDSSDEGEPIVVDSESSVEEGDACCQFDATQKVYPEVHSVTSDKVVSITSEPDGTVQKNDPESPHVTEDEGRPNHDLFYYDSRIEMFMKHLEDNGEKKRDSMITGAQAYSMWRNMDPKKRIEGVLNIDAIDYWVDQRKNVNMNYIITFLKSMAKLLQFFIKKKYVIGNDAVQAKVCLDRVAMHVAVLTVASMPIEEQDDEEEIPDKCETDKHNKKKEGENDDESAKVVLIGKEYCKPMQTDNKDDKVDEQSEKDEEKDRDERDNIAKAIPVEKDQCTSLQTDNKNDKSDLQLKKDDEISTATSIVEDEEIEESPQEGECEKALAIPMTNDFKKWLQGFPKFLTEKGANQHSHQAVVLWNYLTPKNTIEGILERTALNGWINDHINKHQPGTLISYLGSFENLINFLLENDRISDRNGAERMLRHVKDVRKSLKTKVSIRRTVVETEEIGK